MQSGTFMDLWQPFVTAASTIGSSGLTYDLDLADHTLDCMDDDIANLDVTCAMDVT